MLLLPKLLSGKIERGINILYKAVLKNTTLIYSNK